jgi:hypothetical protein
MKLRLMPASRLAVPGSRPLICDGGGLRQYACNMTALAKHSPRDIDASGPPLFHPIVTRREKLVGIMDARADVKEEFWVFGLEGGDGGVLKIRVPPWPYEVAEARRLSPFQAYDIADEKLVYERVLGTWLGITERSATPVEDVCVRVPAVDLVEALVGRAEARGSSPTQLVRSYVVRDQTGRGQTAGQQSAHGVRGREEETGSATSPDSAFYER